MPDVISPAPTPSPYTNPVHTAAMSNAGTSISPSRDAISGAVAGQGLSGVVVARITAPAPGTPADRSARRAASTDRSEVAIPGSTTCLVATPIRDLIHSSVVSSLAVSSSLVTTRGGSHDPSPATTAARILRPSSPFVSQDFREEVAGKPLE